MNKEITKIQNSDVMLQGVKHRSKFRNGFLRERNPLDDAQKCFHKTPILKMSENLNFCFLYIEKPCKNWRLNLTRLNTLLIDFFKFVINIAFHHYRLIPNIAGCLETILGKDLTFIYHSREAPSRESNNIHAH